MIESIHRMRRTLALLLLAVFGFPLLAPAVFAEAALNLPECCRRGGKHHCAMMTDETPADGVSFRTIQPRCPFYPATPIMPAVGYVAVLKSSRAILAAVAGHPVHVQTEARYRISHSRSSQKRGPPVLT
jgi:hypothetical protein